MHLLIRRTGHEALPTRVTGAFCGMGGVCMSCKGVHDLKSCRDIFVTHGRWPGIATHSVHWEALYTFWSAGHGYFA